MRRVGALVALAAILPVATGSPALAAPASDAERVMVALCGGDLINVPLGKGKESPYGNDGPDCAKACHVSDNRRRLDRTQ